MYTAITVYSHSHRAPNRRNDGSEPPEMDEDGLTASWLAVSLGVDPGVLRAMRRGGELVAVPHDSGDVFPSWQFGRDMRPIEGLERVIHAGREAGLDERRLVDLLEHRRAGLVGERRLVDLLREGHLDAVLAAIGAAA